MKPCEFNIYFNPARGAFELYARRTVQDRVEIGQPIVFKTYEKYEAISEPTTLLNKQDVQELMNELWRQGFRPENVEEARGELIATKRHLNDFRRIVSKYIDTNLSIED